MNKRPIILASGSPRRQYLLKEAGFEFTVEKPDIDESFPASLPVESVAKYLAERKAEVFRPRIQNEIVLTADTVVILGNSILNKPADKPEAVRMLQDLSGKTHLVMTGVCIVSKEKEVAFDDTTEVTFKKLSLDEIHYYIDHYKPYDKAGAYGAQDFIGMIAIEKIIGSYFNVMGLPIHRVYQQLTNWL
ncbi:MAG: septum formation protein Maf [Cytophagia bacterium]|nr:septum formation protein Maf [Cytophagia bacterium]